MKKILLSIPVLSLLIIGFAYYYTNYTMPIKFVEKYIDIRYSNVDYKNISERADQQKRMIDKSLINTGFRFGGFDKEVEMFTDNKLKIALIDKKIIERKTNKNLTYITATASISCRSVENNEWEQKTDYKFEFILKKENPFSCSISYIKVLDEKLN